MQSTVRPWVHWFRERSRKIVRRCSRSYWCNARWWAPTHQTPGSLHIRNQWFWQNFIISMCGIKFLKGNKNLRSVYKKTVFRNIERFLPFLGALFTKVICTFLKSVWRDGFFDTPFDLIKEKSFHLIVGSVCTFCVLKSPKWKQPLNISENGFFITGFRISSTF